MTISVDHRSTTCSLSPVIVTSPYELKIIEWDDKPQTNRQAIKTDNQKGTNNFISMKNLVMETSNTRLIPKFDMYTRHNINI